MKTFLLALALSTASVAIGLAAFAWHAHGDLCRDVGTDWVACIIVAGAL